MYWAFRHWLAQEAPRFGHQATFVDTTNLDAVRAAVTPGTALVYIETPGNPLWDISDIAAIAEIAHAAGARLAVNSTVATPVFTNPLALGADLVMHSASKYLNGHSDVIAGVLATARSDEALGAHQGSSHPARRNPRAVRGVAPAARAAHARCARAHAVEECGAARRTSSPRIRRVARVLYPGLPTHPGHAMRRGRCAASARMLSIRVSGGERAAIATAAGVKLWKRATSLGGVESLIEHRASVEGPSSPCPPDLLRLSVGLEDPDDLFADLDRALRAGA